MSLNGVFGSHSAFYYYSKEHLFINLLQYIKNALDNKELVYILMNENKFKELSSFFVAQNVPMDSIFFFTDRSFNDITADLNMDDIRNSMRDILNSATLKGFSGIRFIEDCSHIISITSKEFFLELERNLTNLIKSNKISLLCTYDVYEYIQDSNENHIISKEIITNSIHSHSHLLKNFKLYEV